MVLALLAGLLYTIAGLNSPLSCRYSRLGTDLGLCKHKLFGMVAIDIVVLVVAPVLLDGSLMPNVCAWTRFVTSLMDIRSFIARHLCCCRSL